MKGSGWDVLQRTVAGAARRPCRTGGRFARASHRRRQTGGQVCQRASSTLRGSSTGCAACWTRRMRSAERPLDCSVARWLVGPSSMRCGHACSDDGAARVVREAPINSAGRRVAGAERRDRWMPQMPRDRSPAGVDPAVDRKSAGPVWRLHCGAAGSVDRHACAWPCTGIIWGPHPDRATPRTAGVAVRCRHEAWRCATGSPCLRHRESALWLTPAPDSR